MTVMQEQLVILLTGGREAGKTSLCREAVQWAHARRWDAAGLLSPARFEGPVKVGIDMVDVRSGQSRPLAHLRSQTMRPASSPHTQRWAFDETAVAWGNDVLRDSVPCDLLVVDELGPLELERDEGWIEGIAAVDSRHFQRALVVIRPELVSIAQHRWPLAVLVDVTDLAPARDYLRSLLA